jgi:hypothetical protein
MRVSRQVSSENIQVVYSMEPFWMFLTQKETMAISRPFRHRSRNGSDYSTIRRALVSQFRRLSFSK